MAVSPERASVGFAPIEDPAIETLILGSLPSRRSIEEQRYYAHPQNAFWRIMGELVGAGPNQPYAIRAERLLAAGIGLWDVLASSHRPGSMDADIDLATATANDFDTFLPAHPSLVRVCFNGRKAAELYRRLGCCRAADRDPPLGWITLPSTSPAFASMPFDEKLARWSLIAKAAPTRRRARYVGSSR